MTYIPSTLNHNVKHEVNRDVLARVDRGLDIAEKAVAAFCRLVDRLDQEFRIGGALHK